MAQDKSTWIIDTIEGALQTAQHERLDIRVMRLHPLDFELISTRVPKRIATTALTSPTGILMVRDETILRGHTRLECVKLPDGLEFAKTLDELESAMGVVHARKAKPKNERSN